MGTGRLGLVTVTMVAVLLAGCTAATEPGPSTTGPPSTSAPASPSATSEPSPTPTATGAACEPFGTLAASASSDDWFADLRGGPGEELWGETMRVGTHACYDRWVFEFAGDADMPGWSVTPHDASTFLGDPSGEPIEPLAGTASLEIMFAAWYDGTPIDQPAYAGPSDIASDALPAIKEARILSGFEGITQVGIGLDAAHPYRVTWLTDPGRLVVDVFTG